MPAGRRTRRNRRVRRSRKQRGGAAAASLQDWLAAVKEHRVWKNESDVATLGTYTMAALRDPALAIPGLTRDAEKRIVPAPEWELRPGVFQEEVRDVRELAASVAEILRLIVTDSMTPREFAESIRRSREGQQDADMISFLERLETALRKTVDTDYSGDVVLENSAGYPLYIWYLFMNANPENLVPVLIPVERAESEI